MTGIWYVVGFAFAGVSFVFATIGAAWLISHRNRGDEHKGLPYESGIDTYGDTHGRFGLSFYIYALLFVAFEQCVRLRGRQAESGRHQELVAQPERVGIDGRSERNHRGAS